MPWLRETGIVKHIGRLKKDEIKAVIVLLLLEGEDILKEIVNAIESLLREAYGLYFDRTECILT